MISSAGMTGIPLQQSKIMVSVLSFVDEDGEEIFFNISDVVIFEAPREFIEEGQKEAGEDE